jgi:flagellar biogenesis protein FliO
MEMAQMKLLEMKVTQTEITRMQIPASASRCFTLAVDRLKACWRSVVSGAGSKRKALAVRETAALGDRRFVSVIQFERQRFLIGSSSASVTLLAQLPDESVAEEITKENGEKN